VNRKQMVIERKRNCEMNVSYEASVGRPPLESMLFPLWLIAGKHHLTGTEARAREKGGVSGFRLTGSYLSSKGSSTSPRTARHVSSVKRWAWVLMVENSV